MLRLIRQRPGAVAVLAGGAVGGFRLAVDHDGLLVLAADVAGGGLTALADRCYRAAVAGLGIVPVDRLVERRGVGLLDSLFMMSSRGESPGASHQTSLQAVLDTLPSSSTQ